MDFHGLSGTFRVGMSLFGLWAGLVTAALLYWRLRRPQVRSSNCLVAVGAVAGVYIAFGLIMAPNYTTERQAFLFKDGRAFDARYLNDSDDWNLVPMWPLVVTICKNGC